MRVPAAEAAAQEEDNEDEDEERGGSEEPPPREDGARRAPHDEDLDDVSFSFSEPSEQLSAGWGRAARSGNGSPPGRRDAATSTPERSPPLAVPAQPSPGTVWLDGEVTMDGSASTASGLWSSRRKGAAASASTLARVFVVPSTADVTLAAVDGGGASATVSLCNRASHDVEVDVGSAAASAGLRASVGLLPMPAGTVRTVTLSLGREGGGPLPRAAAAATAAAMMAGEPGVATADADAATDAGGLTGAVRRWSADLQLRVRAAADGAAWAAAPGLALRVTARPEALRATGLADALAAVMGLGPAPGSVPRRGGRGSRGPESARRASPGPAPAPSPAPSPVPSPSPAAATPPRSGARSRLTAASASPRDPSPAPRPAPAMPSFSPPEPAQEPVRRAVRRVAPAQPARRAAPAPSPARPRGAAGGLVLGSTSVFMERAPAGGRSDTRVQVVNTSAAPLAVRFAIRPAPEGGPPGAFSILPEHATVTLRPRSYCMVPVAFHDDGAAIPVRSCTLLADADPAEPLGKHDAVELVLSARADVVCKVQTPRAVPSPASCARRPRTKKRRPTSSPGRRVRRSAAATPSPGRGQWT